MLCSQTYGPPELNFEVQHWVVIMGEIRGQATNPNIPLETIACLTMRPAPVSS